MVLTVLNDTVETPWAGKNHDRIYVVQPPLI